MPPRGNIHTGAAGGMPSPQAWYQGLPPVTKFLLTSVMLVFCGFAFDLVGPYKLALLWKPMWEKFEVWRIVTCAVFLGGPSFKFLIQLMLLIQYSLRYEEDPFNTGAGGGSADYAYMLMFGVAIMETLSLAWFELPFIATPLMYYIIYVWSRKSPLTPVSYWGIVVQAVYAPWLLLAFNLLTGDSVFAPLLGIGVGHLYYFLVDVLPDTYNIDLISTPAFLVNLLGFGRGAAGGATGPVGGPGAQRGGGFAAPGRAAPPPGFQRPGGGGGGGYSWGQGRVLGAG